MLNKKSNGLIRGLSIRKTTSIRLNLRPDVKEPSPPENAKIELETLFYVNHTFSSNACLEVLKLCEFPSEFKSVTKPWKIHDASSNLIRKYFPPRKHWMSGRPQSTAESD